MEPTTATFFDRVRNDLLEVEARMRQGHGAHHPSLDRAIEQLLQSGGKRIRPTVVLLTGEMVGAPPDRALTMAAAIELLHTATLVHDDLIDGSTLRRGAPTLNAQWTAGATVLTGDYVFARAAYLAARTGSLPVMELFARTLMTIVNGELTQLFRTRSDDPRRDYLDRIYAKTASLFELAAEGAAVLGDPHPGVQASMKAFGYHVGMAFQIMDDILDFTGKEALVGKPVAHDLRQGLITLPTLIYLETHPQDGHLLESLTSGPLDEPQAEELIKAIRASDAIERARAEAESLVTAAEGELEGMPDSPAREALFELARYAILRTS
jgi:geranylgeranyl pyrophosphate synthase